MNCIICKTPFQPTNRKHQHCGNICSVSLYVARRKVRLKIKETLKALKTPEEVSEFNKSLDQLLEGAAQ